MRVFRFPNGKARQGSVHLPLIFLVILVSRSSYAQIPPIVDPTGRSGERPREEELQPLKPPPRIVLPPAPLRHEETAGIPSVSIFIREIRVTGSTVFSHEEITQVTERYTNRRLTAEDLEALRIELTLLYVNKGYVNSGAILPDQTPSDGVVTFLIIEGKLTRIEMEGNRWFRSSYLIKRLSLGAEPPLNLIALQERLRLLLEDQRIQRLNAELRPGLKPGEGVLNVLVEERTPYKVWLDFDNYQSPSVGEMRGIVTIEHQNLTGNGDVATARYGRSKGLDPLLDIKYSVPVTVYDTTVSLQYRKDTFAVVEAPFDEIDLKSTSDIYTLGVRQPIYRSPNSQVALELIGERLSSETSLLGQPFSLTPGAENGKSNVTALRTAQEWIYRTPNQVIAARSRFSYGLDAMGATISSNGDPDGRFFAWLGQFQWVRRLGILDTQMIFRTDLQLPNDALPPLEQVAIGGRYSVRGYRETTLLRDSAFLTSLELRAPLIRNARWAEFLELAPFVDFGRGWNKKGSTPDPQALASIGIGLRWAARFSGQVPLRPQFEIYWAHRLKEVESPGGSLQDNGIHLQFVMEMF